MGAGSCWASALIKLQYPNTIVYATDISPTALQRGRQLGDLLQSRIDYFVAMDAERIPFRDGFFDHIFASSTLHHFPHPEKAFSEIHRCLKQPGELVAINEAASSIPFTLLGKMIGALSEGRGKGVTENRYTLRQWRDLLIRGGFTNIIVRVEREEMRAQGGWKALLGTLPTRLLQLLRPDITIYART
jgi:ubiquinone/menaquinone biosynthesis C-methylase UbiE